MKKLNIVFAIILILILCSGLFGCKNSKGEIPSAPNSDTQNVLGDGQFVPSGEYSIICPELYRGSIKMDGAIEGLKNALSKIYGVKTSVSTSEAGAKYEKKIYIGISDTEMEKKLDCELSVDRFAYKLESEDSILICGGSMSAVCDGIEHFCFEMLGFDEKLEEQEKKILSCEASFVSEEKKYPYASYTLGGIAIEDYKIVIDHSRHADFAEPLVLSLGSYTGRAPEVISRDELLGNEQAVFCIGAFDREWSNIFPSGLSGYSIRFDTSDGKITVGFGAANAKDYERAAAAIVDAIKPDESGCADLPINTLSSIKYKNASEYTPTWILAEENEEELSEGVTYRELLYKDADGDPYRAYVLIIDPALNSLYMGSSQDGYEYAPEKKQNVAGHMSSAVENGIDVIAGVNADFFDISGDYHPSGLAVKEGKLISEGAAGRPYFAFTKDGSAIVGYNCADAEVESLRTAVGGSHVLVHNSFPQLFDMSDAFSYVGHPRTLAGVREDGKIILAVIDGRQPSVSNGASLEQCALFMMSLGASEAINLDGGGSSTMIVERDGELVTENSGSDGALRKIYNSLIVIKN